MKRQMKVFLGIFTFCLCALPFMNVNAATTVNNEGDLTAALNGTETEIILGADITTTSPIQVSKDVTIDGAGQYSIIAGYTGTDGNKTIIASTTSGTLTLKDITLKNSPKYGTQAHNGGHVVLDGVTIENSGYGAALANGGTITVKSLTLKNNAYGIEFGVGDEVTGTPALVMDGSIDFTEQTTGDKIYADTTQVTDIIVKNTTNATQKLSYENGKVVLTDENGSVVATSNDLPAEVTVDVDNEEVTTPEEPTTPDTTTPEDTTNNAEEVTNPKTADSILLITLALLVSGGAAVFAGRKIASQRM